MNSMIPFYENKPESVYAFRFPNITFPPHMHIVIEMMYLLSGEVQVSIENENFTLKEGDVFVAFPNQVHSYESVSCENLMILLPVSAIGSMSGLIQGMHPKRYFLRAAEMPEYVPSVLNAFYKSYLTASPEEQEALAHAAFTGIVTKLGLTETENARPTIIGRAMELITNSYRQPITLQWLAQKLGVSKCYLSRELNLFLKMGFREYINCLRIDYAKNMLKQTNLSITEIALESGFDNPRTFNRAFQAVTGTTPRLFRKGSHSFA